MTGSLEQAIARALDEIPHEEKCWSRLKYERAQPCVCDREQRLATRVALWMKASWVAALNNEDMDDVLRALSPQEEPK